MSYCAPSRRVQNKWTVNPEKTSPGSYTCFALEELELMCSALNRTKLGAIRPIDIQEIRNRVGNDKTMYKKMLWKALRDRFAPYCAENEACWLDNVDLGRQLKSISPTAYNILNHFTLKPKGTKQKNGWLSTTEIDYVMHQYAEVLGKTKDFVYIGCFPSDYYELSPQKFPAKELDSFARAAIVFNLDESHQKGSHWVAMYFDVDEITGTRIVEYFDPTGDPPNENLVRFLSHPYFRDAIVVVSKKRHQRGKSECGVYSLFYILERICGTSMNEINENRIGDREMNEFRKVLFRPWTPKYEL